MGRKKKNIDTSVLGDDEHIGMDEKTWEASINKQYGKGIMRLGDSLEDPDPNYSGSLALDIDLRIPFPAGAMIEISGSEGSGKTTLTLEILGQAQQAGKRVAYCNAERNLNRSLINSIRTLNPAKLRILEGNNGEENLQLVQKYIANFPNSVVVVDSVDALVPEAILAGDIGDATVGLHPRLMSNACRKLKDICAINKSTIIFVNQIREKIGSYGDPEETPGGRALKFYSSQRIRLKPVRKADQIKDNDGGHIIGHTARYYIIKNKSAPPFIDGVFPLMYGKGIYRELEVAQMLKDLGLVDTGGSGGHGIYLTLPEDEEGKAEEKVCYINQAAELFESSPSLYKKYYDMIMDNFNER